MTIVVKDLNEYQVLALKTVKPDDFLQSVLHCVMGMAGEVGEFIELTHQERDQRIGEIGDCMWYSAVLSNLLGLQYEYVMERAAHQRGGASSLHLTLSGEEVAVIWACRLIDRVKKSVFYGKSIDHEALTVELIGYCSGLIGMAQKTSVSLVSAGQINIKKLAERYKDGRFNADHAINRDYQAESAAAGVQIA